MASIEEPVTLTELQKKIYQTITNNNIAELTPLLAECKGDVDFIDENGMSPLQHAAYKGNKEVVQLLIDNGADVNNCQHQFTYTALHFAALSGSSEVCQTLLLAGAKTTTVNSVGRTASQMAAFVNNHHSVATINNFIPRSTIDYYTEPQGLQTEAILPKFLGDSLHKFAMLVNLHPVYVVQSLQRFTGLFDHLKDVHKTLELMSEREMKHGTEPNEIMSFKFHFLSCIVGEVKRTIERQNKDGDKKAPADIVELMAKKLLKTNKEGVPDFQESFIRECVREFPYRECATFRQVVTTLAGQDPPPAINVIMAAINGQRGFQDNIVYCSTCGSERPAKKCSKCRAVQYCDRECQRLHWFLHKKACARLAEAPNTTGSTAAGTPPSGGNVDAAEISAQLQNLITG